MKDSFFLQCCGNTKNGYGARCENKFKSTYPGEVYALSYCHFHSDQRTGDIEEMPELEDICTICQEVCNNPSNFIKTICNHFFHKSCWLKLYKWPENMQCPLCRRNNPTPDMKPHLYSVSVVQIGLQDWELHIRENYFYDYGDVEERKHMVAERICSAVRHAKVHGAITLSIVGKKNLLDEVFSNPAQFSPVINTFTLLYAMGMVTRQGHDGNSDGDGESENIYMHPFLFVQLDD